MPITRVQYAKGGATGSVTTIATAGFGSAITAGNTIAAFFRSAQDQVAGITMSDSAGNNYTQAAIDTSADPRVSSWYCEDILGAASGVTVTANFATGAGFVWLVAVEYAGVATSGVLDTDGAHRGTAATDLVSDSLSTAVAGEVLTMAVSQNALATFSAGTDFTLIDGTLGQGGNYGGVEEYITTGTLSSYTAHITSDTSAAYCTAWIALKPGATESPPLIFDWSRFPKAILRRS